MVIQIILNNHSAYREYGKLFNFVNNYKDRIYGINNSPKYVLNLISWIKLWTFIPRFKLSIGPVSIYIM